MKKKIAIILLVLLVAAILAGPALAALVYEHQWDTRVWIHDRQAGDVYFYSYGYNNHAPFVGDKLFYKEFSCPGSLGERVRVYAKGNGAVAVDGGCAQMTPTPAPTMQP